ncbi:hypothetical protein GCM10007940_05110 [Portibacter lacus]|uniref:YARHG domain-containing protein n=1 Tax=Portibacter lacus TaxID=1099794 RepID=A0AA37WBY7_9BACT|nr:hypothetical protein GCM10007940_05110 [Portibacter lacus]
MVQRNLLFVRRGFVYRNIELKEYYENLEWFIPNKNYLPTIETLLKKKKDLKVINLSFFYSCA